MFKYFIKLRQRFWSFYSIGKCTLDIFYQILGESICRVQVLCPNVYNVFSILQCIMVYVQLHVSLYKRVHICLFVTIRGKSIEGEVFWILAKELQIYQLLVSFKFPCNSFKRGIPTKHVCAAQCQHFSSFIWYLNCTNFMQHGT